MLACALKDEGSFLKKLGAGRGSIPDGVDDFNAMVVMNNSRHKNIEGIFCLII